MPDPFLDPLSPATKAEAIHLLGPRTHPKSVMINFTVLSPVKDFLREIATRENKTLSVVIREAITEHLKTK